MPKVLKDRVTPRKPRKPSSVFRKGRYAITPNSRAAGDASIAFSRSVMTQDNFLSIVSWIEGNKDNLARKHSAIKIFYASWTGVVPQRSKFPVDLDAGTMRFDYETNAAGKPVDANGDRLWTAIRNTDTTRHVLHEALCDRCAEAGLTSCFYDTLGPSQHECLRCLAHKFRCSCRVPSKGEVLDEAIALLTGVSMVEGGAGGHTYAKSLLERLRAAPSKKGLDEAMAFVVGASAGNENSAFEMVKVRLERYRTAR